MRPVYVSWMLPNRIDWNITRALVQKTKIALSGCLRITHKQSLSSRLEKWRQESYFSTLRDLVTARFQIESKGVVRGGGDDSCEKRSIATAVITWNALTRH